MKYYLIVGEASGDLHASNLMSALKEKDPDADFRFFGGDLMQQVGGTLVKHYREMAFMGIVPVLMHLRTILHNMDFCRSDIRKYAPDVVFLEGAGGICVPLSAGVLTAELIKYLGFEVIIVAPAGLGSINHTLLSLEYLRNRDIRIAGVILNQFSIPPTEIELDNIRMIESFGRVGILAKASDGAAEFSECRLFEK